MCNVTVLCCVGLCCRRQSRSQKMRRRSESLLAVGQYSDDVSQVHLVNFWSLQLFENSSWTLIRALLRILRAYDVIGILVGVRTLMLHLHDLCDSSVRFSLYFLFRLANLSFLSLTDRVQLTFTLVVVSLEQCSWIELTWIDWTELDWTGVDWTGQRFQPVAAASVHGILLHCWLLVRRTRIVWTESLTCSWTLRIHCDACVLTLESQTPVGPVLTHLERT